MCFKNYTYDKQKHDYIKTILTFLKKPQFVIIWLPEKLNALTIQGFP